MPKIINIVLLLALTLSIHATNIEPDEKNIPTDNNANGAIILKVNVIKMTNKYKPTRKYEVFTSLTLKNIKTGYKKRIHKNGEWTILELPPGRYKIDSVKTYKNVSFKHEGGPFFDIKPSEIEIGGLMTMGIYYDRDIVTHKIFGINRWPNNLWEEQSNENRNIISRYEEKEVNDDFPKTWYLWNAAGITTALKLYPDGSAQLGTHTMERVIYGKGKWSRENDIYSVEFSKGFEVYKLRKDNELLRGYGEWKRDNYRAFRYGTTKIEHLTYKYKNMTEPHMVEEYILTQPQEMAKSINKGSLDIELSLSPSNKYPNVYQVASSTVTNSSVPAKYNDELRKQISENLYSMPESFNHRVDTLLHNVTIENSESRKEISLNHSLSEITQ